MTIRKREEILVEENGVNDCEKRNMTDMFLKTKSNVD